MPDQHACTCPSGDGSLRWPCPVHMTAVEAGGCAPPVVVDGPAAKRWPFVESPGEFTARLARAMQEFPLLGAVRHVLIENPPALSQQPAAVDGRIAIEPGERLFQFDSKQEWINHASRIWRFHGVSTLDTVCVDALGRLVNIGKHFADAERDRAYPIVVYRLRADMNRNTGAAQQGGADHG